MHFHDTLLFTLLTALLGVSAHGTDSLRKSEPGLPSADSIADGELHEREPVGGAYQEHAGPTSTNSGVSSAPSLRRRMQYPDLSPDHPLNVPHWPSPSSSDTPTPWPSPQPQPMAHAPTMIPYCREAVPLIHLMCAAYCQCNQDGVIHCSLAINHRNWPGQAPVPELPVGQNPQTVQVTCRSQCECGPGGERIIQAYSRETGGGSGHGSPRSGHGSPRSGHGSPRSGHGSPRSGHGLPNGVSHVDGGGTGQGSPRGSLGLSDSLGRLATRDAADDERVKTSDVPTEQSSNHGYSPRRSAAHGSGQLLGPGISFNRAEISTDGSQSWSDDSEKVYKSQKWERESLARPGSLSHGSGNSAGQDKYGYGISSGSSRKSTARSMMLNKLQCADVQCQLDCHCDAVATVQCSEMPGRSSEERTRECRLSCYCDLSGTEQEVVTAQTTHGKHIFARATDMSGKLPHQTSSEADNRHSPGHSEVFATHRDSLSHQARKREAGRNNRKNFLDPAPAEKSLPRADTTPAQRPLQTVEATPAQRPLRFNYIPQCKKPIGYTAGLCMNYCRCSDVGLLWCPPGMGPMDQNLLQKPANYPLEQLEVTCQSNCKCVMIRSNQDIQALYQSIVSLPDARPGDAKAGSSKNTASSEKPAVSNKGVTANKSATLKPRADRQSPGAGKGENSGPSGHSGTGSAYPESPRHPASPDHRENPFYSGSPMTSPDSNEIPSSDDLLTESSMGSKTSTDNSGQTHPHPHSHWSSLVCDEPQDQGQHCTENCRCDAKGKVRCNPLPIYRDRAMATFHCRHICKCFPDETDDSQPEGHSRHTASSDRAGQAGPSSQRESRKRKGGSESPGPPAKKQGNSLFGISTVNTLPRHHNFPRSAMQSAQSNVSLGKRRPSYGSQTKESESESNDESRSCSNQRGVYHQMCKDITGNMPAALPRIPAAYCEYKCWCDSKGVTRCQPYENQDGELWNEKSVMDSCRLMCTCRRCQEADHTKARQDARAARKAMQRTTVGEPIDSQSTAAAVTSANEISPRSATFYPPLSAATDLHTVKGTESLSQTRIAARAAMEGFPNPKSSQCFDHSFSSDTASSDDETRASLVLKGVFHMKRKQGKANTRDHSAGIPEFYCEQNCWCDSRGVVRCYAYDGRLGELWDHENVIGACRAACECSRCSAADERQCRQDKRAARKATKKEIGPVTVNVEHTVLPRAAMFYVPRPPTPPQPDKAPKPDQSDTSPELLPGPRIRTATPVFDDGYPHWVFRFSNPKGNPIGEKCIKFCFCSVSGKLTCAEGLIFGHPAASSEYAASICGEWGWCKAIRRSRAKGHAKPRVKDHAGPSGEISRRHEGGRLDAAIAPSTTDLQAVETVETSLQKHIAGRAAKPKKASGLNTADIFYGVRGSISSPSDTFRLACLRIDAPARLREMFTAWCRCSASGRVICRAFLAPYSFGHWDGAQAASHCILACHCERVESEGRERPEAGIAGPCSQIIRRHEESSLDAVRPPSTDVHTVESVETSSEKHIVARDAMQNQPPPPNTRASSENSDSSDMSFKSARDYGNAQHELEDTSHLSSSHRFRSADSDRTLLVCSPLHTPPYLTKLYLKWCSCSATGQVMCFGFPAPYGAGYWDSTRATRECHLTCWCEAAGGPGGRHAEVAGPSKGTHPWREGESGDEGGQVAKKLKTKSGR